MEKRGIALFVAVVAAFAFGWITYPFVWRRGAEPPEIVRDTVVLARVDTFRIEKPVPYPVPAKPLPPDTVYVAVGDSTLPVEIPMEQKAYGDTLYTAWVSGYRPRLDSIRIYRPTITQVITETRTVRQEPKP